MMKYLFPDICWENIRCIGFDLDGTLYDEFDFIVQVYHTIAAHVADYSPCSEEEIFQNMCCLWLEKGSAYAGLFNEVIAQFVDGQENISGRILQECIERYRSFNPLLLLPSRIEFLLNRIKTSYPLFLVTDGHRILQEAKFFALRLNRWFDRRNVLILESQKEQKPNVTKLHAIACLREVDKNQVVYFGDREVDNQFAIRAGFIFHLLDIKRGYE